MLYGYCRCSTNASMQDVDRQVRELLGIGVARENIYFEYIQGTNKAKGEWCKLIGKVASGDTIAVTEVSRITRTSEQLNEIIDMALDKRIQLRIGSLIIDCRRELDPMSIRVISMMGAQIEMELALISHRVKSGMRNAKAKGAVFGRPKTTKDNLPESFKELFPDYISGELTVTDYAELCGISRQTVYKYLKIIESEEV